jgi:anthranilate phosphoribosyltransferase
VVLLNAGAALLVGGMASDLRDGITQAGASVDSGAAFAKLQGLVALSQQLGAQTA